MNREKISDFVNVWAKTVKLTDVNIINVIKSDIAKRCQMYEGQVPHITVEQDDCKAYIIKPVNGKYSLEDFFLNRLMLGIREVDFSETIDGTSGHYIAQYKNLSVDVRKIDALALEKATRHSGLKGQNIRIRKKTIEHELGHCLKTRFSNGIEEYPTERSKEEVYRQLIGNLQQYENGKYAPQIKRFEELDSQEQSKAIKTGVHDAGRVYSNDRRIEHIDELLNETEALELTESNVVHERMQLKNEQREPSDSGNYVNVYNYLSGYRTFTGYGPILKSLIGKKKTFEAEYISSKTIFEDFDKEYSDVVEQVWGTKYRDIPPMKCIFAYFDGLRNGKSFDEGAILKLDEFFARCYSKKVEKAISRQGGKVSETFRENILGKIEMFQERMTTNDDEDKRNALPHNIVFEEIKTRLKKLSIEGPQVSQEQQPKIRPTQVAQIAESQKVTLSEIQEVAQAAQEMGMRDIKKIMFRKQTGQPLTEEEEMRLNEYEKQRKQHSSNEIKNTNGIIQ